MFLVIAVASAGECLAHEQTRARAQAVVAQAGAQEHSVAVAERPCRLHLELRDATSGDLAPGLVRITSAEFRREPLELDGLFRRPAGWHSATGQAVVRVPRGRWRIEATRGVEYGVATAVLDLTVETERKLTLSLNRIFDTRTAGLRSANTHLHLMLNNERQIGSQLRDRRDVDAYLRTVGGSDALDLVYVSRLERPGNEYVTNDYTSDDLARLSGNETLFANGVEHRHGRSLSFRLGGLVIDGQPSVMAYGHVLLLSIEDGSVAPSIGPGLTDGVDPTDRTPLRAGIVTAREKGGGVIWCHGLQGLEDTPNWVAGLLDAQNIFDGGNEGSFETVFYPYLNAGFKVPFSTGTDWGIWDFSRVFVALPGELTSRGFLGALKAGRSFITNEPILELDVEQHVPGDTIELDAPRRLRIRGRAVGRSDFLRLQLVQNGEVVHEAPSRARPDFFEAVIETQVPVSGSGWLALRISPNAPYSLYDSNETGPGFNIFGKPIFAHTSPIYVSVGGRPLRDPVAISTLKRRLELAASTIEKAGVFRSDEERLRVIAIYSDAESHLDSLLETARSNQPVLTPPQPE